MQSINTNDIGFVLGIFWVIGIIFSVFRYFKTPQEKTEKTEVLFWEKISNLQLSMIDVKKTFDLQIANLKDNHLHSLDLKIDAVKDSVSSLALVVKWLSVIIEERIPQK